MFHGVFYIRQLSLCSSSPFVDPKCPLEAVLTSFVCDLFCVNKEMTGLINQWLSFMPLNMHVAKMRPV
jgi:hypothetical protein